MKIGDRREVEGWANPAALRAGLIYYQQQNTIKVYTPADDLYSLTFNFSPLGPEVHYLRRIEFDVRGSSSHVSRVEWHVSESAVDPPATLAALLETAPPEVIEASGKAKIFFEMYEGIFSRLFPKVEHGDLHTDSSSENYDE